MKQTVTTTKRHVLKPGEWQAFCAEVSPIGDGATPTRVIGWTKKAVWSRLSVDYPNGWNLIVYFDRLGKVSSQTASYTAKFELKGKAAA